MPFPFEATRRPAPDGMEILFDLSLSSSRFAITMSEAADLDVCDSMQREEWQVLEVCSAYQFNHSKQLKNQISVDLSRVCQ